MALQFKGGKAEPIGKLQSSPQARSTADGLARDINSASQQVVRLKSTAQALKQQIGAAGGDVIEADLIVTEMSNAYDALQSALVKVRQFRA